MLDSAQPLEQLQPGKNHIDIDETFFLEGSSISKIGDVGGPGQTIFGSVLVDGTENLRVQLINSLMKPVFMLPLMRIIDWC